MGKTVPDRATSCGLFSWRPDWMQKFANKKYYLILYALIGTLQGMTFSYLTVVLSTIERRFGLKSKEAAWIYSGNEISQIFFIVFLPFVGRVKKRPMFMALSTALAALGLFIIALPHFSGDQNYLKDAIIENSKKDDVALCHPGEPREENCSADHQYKDWVSIWIVFFGIFLLGIATSFYYSFGLPYVDDNSEKQDSPFYLSLVMAARTVGPAFGYILGSRCLTLYADPRNVPDGLTEESPSWIGAWWIGFFLIGCALTIVSPWLGFFPERLPAAKTDAEKMAEERSLEKEPQTAAEWTKELLEVSKRLFSRPIFVYNLASSTFFLLGVIGYFTFIPKYFEYHFRQTASKVGTTGGLSQSISSAVGILASGYIMKRFKLRARPLAAWCCAADIIFVLAFVVIAFMKCPPLTMYGQVQENGLVKVDGLPCINNCDCTGVHYQPICSRDGYTNFFSPCHAGCKQVNRTKVAGKKGNIQDKKFYWDCSCMAENFADHKELTLASPWWKEIETDEENHIAELPSPLSPAGSSQNTGLYSAGVDDYCKVDCDSQYYILIGFMFIAGLIGASTRLPNTMLSLRTIDKRDKAASFTLSLSVMSLFAILPSPLIVGAVMDETCVIWGQKCGETTNCLVYDIDKMRVYLAIFPAICIIISFIFDVGVWFHAKDLSIYGDQQDVENSVDTNTHMNSLSTKSTEINSNERGHLNGSFEMIPLDDDK